jgi:hypothetical protein
VAFSKVGKTAVSLETFGLKHPFRKMTAEMMIATVKILFLFFAANVRFNTNIRKSDE